MEGRTRLALGGIATATASIAVVCAVAMTTSAALADAAGVPVGARAVVVPASVADATPFASTSAAPSTTASPQPPSGPHAVEAETVPAPEPRDVVGGTTPTPSVFSEPSPAVEDQLIAEVAVSGTWDAVYAWAQERGWSSDRTASWIARLESKVAESRKNGGSDPADLTDSTAGDRIAPLLPAEADDTSGLDQSGSESGSKRERSRVPPD